MKKTKRKSRRSKRNKTIRYISRGGDTTSKSNMESQSLDQLAELKESREKENEGGLTDMIQGVGIGALKNISNGVGIDVDSPKEVEKTLDNFKEIFTNPNNIKNTSEIISNAANNASVYVKAAEPLIGPLTDTALEVGSKTMEKAGETATVIVSNAVKEIPGVGLAYSLVQDASKIGEAISAATNAAAELTTSTADSAVVFKRNLEQLQNEAANATKGLDVSVPNTDDMLSKVGSNMTANATNTLSKVGSNMTANATNTLSKVGSSIPNTSDTLSKVGSNMTNNIVSNAIQKGGLKKLANEGLQIGGRIIDSLAEFADPIGYQSGILKGGHNKTKRAIMVNGNDRKSRRVRFSM